MTLPPEAERFLEGLTDLTADAYRVDLGQLAAHLAPLSLLGASLADLKSWSAALEAKGLKPATTQRKLAAAKSFYRWAWEEELLSSNPAARLRSPKVPARDSGRYLSPEQVAIIVGNCRPGRDRLLARTLFGLGARVSEVCRLGFSDLRDGQKVRVVGKGNRERVVSCPDSVWPELLEAARAAGPGAKIFGIDRRAAWQIIHDAGAANGIHAMPHGLRHGHASAAIAAGCDLQAVRHQLGHASLTTTSVYAGGGGDRSSSGDFLEIPD
ncbi:hypothetical protein C7293_13760 [filamentous cyanobacterium CCT1]|nr:hypothetical protein C7293_13760 [filamentous cyanobacterium CCT1]PSN80388.1 hypothetical protein C8B47_06690 [filamentous cyanobacterium CCP4]